MSGAVGWGLGIRWLPIALLPDVTSTSDPGIVGRWHVPEPPAMGVEIPTWRVVSARTRTPMERRQFGQRHPRLLTLACEYDRMDKLRRSSAAAFP